MHRPAEVLPSLYVPRRLWSSLGKPRVAVVKSARGESVSKLESRSKKLRKTPSKHLRSKSKCARSKMRKPVFSSMACASSFETDSPLALCRRGNRPKRSQIGRASCRERVEKAGVDVTI